MVARKNLQTLRIGGVPEHFNLPWHQLLESGALRAAGIDASWTDYPGGSGQMAAAFAAGEVDMAMLLTEGAVAARARGGRFRIVSAYTVSPLVWGIHVAAHSALRELADLRGRTYAVSRIGSGSHVMAGVHARAQGWPVSELKFEIVGNLAGARAALRDGKADIFLWEKFTTEPYVNNGEFRHVADFPAPWSGFVVCVSEKLLAQAPRAVGVAIRAVQASAFALAHDPQRVAMVAQRYDLHHERVAQWFEITAWATRLHIDKAMLATVRQTLAGIGVIELSSDPRR